MKVKTSTLKLAEFENNEQRILEDAAKVIDKMINVIHYNDADTFLCGKNSESTRRYSDLELLDMCHRLITIASANFIVVGRYEG